MDELNWRLKPEIASELDKIRKQKNKKSKKFDKQIESFLDNMFEK